MESLKKFIALFAIKLNNRLKKVEKCGIITGGGEIVQYTYSWQKCPICGNPKMFKTRDDTQAKNFPCFCKRCKQERS